LGSPAFIQNEEVEEDKKNLDIQKQLWNNPTKDFTYMF